MVHMSKALTCGGLLVGFMFVYGCASSGSQAPNAVKGGKGGKKGGDVPVTVVKVSRRDVPINIQVIGNVEPYSAIAVKAQVGGVLNKVSFQEGDFVKTGDLLFSIDPRPLKAQLDQMMATLAKNNAQLKQAEANLARDIAQEQYARAQANRYAKLMEEGVISKEQAEQTRTNADAVAQAVSADRAAIESVKAEIVATQATVENYKVQLGYTEIRSPIDGRTGSIMVKQGNVVNANTMDLMTINQVEPIYITFAVPESQLRDVKKYMAVGKLPVSVAPQDDDTRIETGTLTFVDNAVDAATGTIKLKGTFPNHEHRLWPGQFVRVTLRLTTHANALVVPNQAVQTGQDGEFVFVVKEDRTVESRPVTTSVRVDQDLMISKGLEFGETVVTEGQLRLSPGVRVTTGDRNRKGGEKKGRPTT
ncbi:MAG TPA: efflux RND transporter periplasmic adaptor subunit [Bryobacteraceae bacterium]|nr:efflux RND transporter periplasmic adaptor subunit [Bryobacteraceae bacterium]